jgi:hypothetical protein
MLIILELKWRYTVSFLDGKSKQYILNLAYLSATSPEARNELMSIGNEAYRIITGEAITLSELVNDQIDGKFRAVPTFDLSTFTDNNPLMYAAKIAYDMLAMERSLLPSDPKLDSFCNNDLFIKYKLGIIILLTILMDSYDDKCEEGTNNTAINEFINGTDIGTKIVKHLLSDKEKGIYPEWLTSRSINDLLDIASRTNDINFVTDVFTSLKNEDSQYLILSKSNICSIIDLIQKKHVNITSAPNDMVNSKIGRKPLDNLYFDLKVAKTGIIAGVVFAGRGKFVVEMQNCDAKKNNVTLITGRLVGLSESSVNRYCYVSGSVKMQ